jgi:cytochrome b561
MRASCTPVAKGLHGLMAVLIVVVALWHQVVLKGDTLRRMGWRA